MKTNTIIRRAATLLDAGAFSASAQVVKKVNDPVEWVYPLNMRRGTREQDAPYSLSRDSRQSMQ